MQQRKSTLGRPSGTDGSDYSYRMVVDSRYQLVAKGKKRLSVLFIIEALFLNIGGVFAFLPRTKEDIQNTVAISSVIASVVLLIIADIGRRRSRSGLLRLYAVLSSIAILLFTVSLANQYSLLKVIHYFSNRGTSNVDFPSLQTGLLVYILTLSLFKIITIKAVIFLLFNMTPPKKAS
ncbi:jagunal protein [Trifolium repens]|nr:jagunal protein [Trifolium repens]